MAQQWMRNVVDSRGQPAPAAAGTNAPSAAAAERIVRWTSETWPTEDAVAGAPLTASGRVTSWWPLLVRSQAYGGYLRGDRATDAARRYIAVQVAVGESSDDAALEAALQGWASMIEATGSDAPESAARNVVVGPREFVFWAPDTLLADLRAQSTSARARPAPLCPGDEVRVTTRGAAPLTAAFELTAEADVQLATRNLQGETAMYANSGVGVDGEGGLAAQVFAAKGGMGAAPAPVVNEDVDEDEWDDSD